MLFNFSNRFNYTGCQDNVLILLTYVLIEWLTKCNFYKIRKFVFQCDWQDEYVIVIYAFIQNNPEFKMNRKPQRKYQNL